MTVGLLVNVDVPDLAAAERFYTAALGLSPGRRLGGTILELTGAAVPVYLIEQPAGSAGAGTDPRRYDRHWCPVHLDLLVADIDAAAARAIAAGATAEGPMLDLPYGRQASFADPFGHGFCLIEMNRSGYDAIAR